MEMQKENMKKDDMGEKEGLDFGSEFVWGTCKIQNTFLSVSQRSQICLHEMRWMKSPKV